jgi:hypothetical protein
MTDPTLKARAAALFRQVAAEERANARAEDKARVEREREKMARLRATRLAAGGKGNP